MFTSYQDIIARWSQSTLELPLEVPDATELAEQIRKHEILPYDIIAYHLNRTEALHEQLNAAISFFKEDALSQAHHPKQGPLSGVPVSLSESIALKNKPITAGSSRMTPYIPLQDAEVTRKLREAGAIIVSRSNISEFAFFSETHNLIYGTTRNPLNTGRSCGGASGGEGVLVAAGCSAVGIGTDLSGSLRLPAHCNGVVAFKPASGAVDKTGVFPRSQGLVDSMLAVGPITRSVRDARLVYNVIANRPSRNLLPVQELELLTPKGFKGLYRDPLIRSAYHDSIEVLLENGMQPIKEWFLDAGELHQHYADLVTSQWKQHILELSRTHEGNPLNLFVETFQQITGQPTVSDQLYTFLIKNRWNNPSKHQLRKYEDQIKSARDKILKLLPSNRVMILPTCAALAMKQGTFGWLFQNSGVNPLFTCTIFPNALDLPAISIPAWKFRDQTTGLVPGISLICSPGAEDALFSAALQLEQGLKSAEHGLPPQA